MDEEYVLGLLLEIVKRSGAWLLEERGEVAPYGVSIVGEHGEPSSFFPEGEAPSAPWPELLERVVSELRSRAHKQPPFGVAVVMGLTLGSLKAFGAQIEIPTCSVRAVFRYRKLSDRWLIDEPEFDKDLLVKDGVCWAPG